MEEARNEIKRLRELLIRCEPFMMILEEETEAREREFSKLIKEVEAEIQEKP